MRLHFARLAEWSGSRVVREIPRTTGEDTQEFAELEIISRLAKG